MKTLDFLRKWGVVIVAILLAIIIVKCQRDNANKQGENDKVIVDSFVNQKLDSSLILYWRDKYNNEHATVSKYIAANTVQSKMIDSIKRLLHVKAKNITSVSQTRIKSTIKAPLTTGIITRSPIDTGKGDMSNYLVSDIEKVNFKWSDQWTKISGSVSFDKESDSISYSSIDTLSAVDYWKRKKVFGLRIGKSVGYVDYTNKNPNNSIIGAKKIDLHPPKTKYSLNLSINAGYPLTRLPEWKKPQITVGLSIGKTLIKF